MERMKKIIFFIKIVLSIIILVIIFSKIDLSQFLITIREVTFFTIIGIAFVGSLKIILQISLEIHQFPIQIFLMSVWYEQKNGRI